MPFRTIYGTSTVCGFNTAIISLVWQACLGQPFDGVWRTAMKSEAPVPRFRGCRAGFAFHHTNAIVRQRTYNVLTSNSTVGEVVEVISPLRARGSR